MPATFAVGQPKPLWQRVLPWALLASVPLLAFVLFVLFLAVNQIGNQVPEGPLPPATVVEGIFAQHPSLYFLVWPYDTRPSRERLLALWREELGRLASPDSPPAASAEEAAERAEHAQALQDAISRIEAELSPQPPGGPGR